MIYFRLVRYTQILVKERSLAVLFTYRPWSGRLNATIISKFSDCEFALACHSLFADMPAVAVPIHFIYGLVIANFYQRIYEAPAEKANSLAKYGVFYLHQVLAQRHGPRSETSSPEEVEWFGRNSREIETAKKKYIGLSVLALRAIALERQEPSPFVLNLMEYDLGPHNLLLPVPGEERPPLILNGRLDRLAFTDMDPYNSAGDYAIFEGKTGEAHNAWQRNKVVRDIQTTKYEYAVTTIFGRPPRWVFIQPFNMSGAHLRQYQGRALEKNRILVERRHAAHREHLVKLAADVYDVIQMVTRPDLFSVGQRRLWQPRSEWGKMANFRQNIDENRFIPRISENWCRACQYCRLCQEANADDWDKHRQTVSGGKISARTVALPAPKPVETELTLFGAMPKKKPLGKTNRVLKKELLASNRFIELRRVPALVKKLQAMIPGENGNLCPCRRLGLVPFFIFDYLKDGKFPPDALRACPYEDCPHRRTLVAVGAPASF